MGAKFGPVLGHASTERIGIVFGKYGANFLKREARIRQRTNRLKPEKIVWPVVAIPVLSHLRRLENAHMVVVDKRIFRGLAQFGEFPRFEQRFHPASFSSAKRRRGRDSHRGIFAFSLDPMVTR